MKNKKFWLIIAFFTLTVPGFMLFSYWYLGIFSPVQVSDSAEKIELVLIGGRVNGDYNKTGQEVVKTRRLLLEQGFPCEPILVYFDNAITTGKAYLRSMGGCIMPPNLPPQLLQTLLQTGREKHSIIMPRAIRIRTYAQTAVALRKVWKEIARLSEQNRKLVFPLVQRIGDDGGNDFLIGTEPSEGSH